MNISAESKLNVCKHSISDLSFISNQSLGIAEDSYAQMPIPVVEKGKLIVYFTTRNEGNQSLPMVTEIDPKTWGIVRKATQINLKLGTLGSFDDDGIMPSSIVDTALGTMMYYIGWNRSVSVPYRLAIGLAVKPRGSNEFRKYSTGPVLDRSTKIPFFITTPQVVMRNGRFRMLMSVGQEWQTKDNRTESVYSTMSALSEDGIFWEDFEPLELGSEENEVCIARPFEIDSHVYYSERRIFDFRMKNQGYRIKVKNVSETPVKKTCSIYWNKGNNDEDRSYASVIELNKKRIIFYNGEKFGKNGFHIAEERISDKWN